MADAPPPLPPPWGKPPSYREDALAVVKRLRDNGHVAYFAGGCVRDTLLGLAPKDWDVATDAPPDRVRKLFTNTQAVGAAFGVILVRHGRGQIEVATFRSDLEYQDGRRPVGVRFTSAEEDAKRRDFTINGLFLDPIDDRVIDYVGGQEDLKAKILRAIGDANHRFEEDHLRMLRAVRFAARFGLEIEPATAAAIRKHAEHLKRISPERIADELRRTFTLPEQGGDWAWHALLLDYPTLSDVIFRFLGDPPEARAREKHIRIFKGFPADEAWPFGLCLAAVTLDWEVLRTHSSEITAMLTRPSIQHTSRGVRQSLRVSNDELDEMTGALEGLALLLRESSLSVVTLKRFLARPTARLSRLLLNQLACYVGAVRIASLNEELDAVAHTDFAPAPLITGDDLTAQGLNPGPLFKRVLDAVYDAQLEDRVKTQEEALELALKLAKEKT